MKTNPLISVIVPIYKVEAYLDRCVESIVNQTYKNLEIILVDDGSPDNCPRMCDDWAKKDNRIKVIHKSNGGLSDARNAGMAVANGELMGFVDSDDYISEDMYQALYDDMVENDSDISACGVEMVWEENGQVRALTISGTYLLTNEEAMRATIEETFIKQPVWYKLYKTEQIKELCFPVGKYHEDVFWTYRAVAKAKKVSIFDNKCYFYVQRGESIMGDGYSSKRLDSIEAAEQRCEYINQNYPNLAALAQMRFIGMCLFNSQQLLKWKIEDYKELFENLHTKAKSVGNQWKKQNDISKKQRMWLSLYLKFPKIICKIRNVLKIGL